MTTQQLSVRLRTDVINDLKALANAQGITATSALQNAVSTEKYIRALIKEGSTILVKNGDEIKELVFR